MQTTTQTAREIVARRFGPEAITSESSDGILIVHVDNPTREYTNEHGQRVLVLTRNEAIDRLSIIDIMEVYRTVRGGLRAMGALGRIAISRERLAREFVDEYERRTGQTRGALAYLAERATEHGAFVDRSGVSNWKAGAGAKYADGSGPDTAIRAAVETYLDL